MLRKRERERREVINILLFALTENTQQGLFKRHFIIMTWLPILIFLPVLLFKIVLTLRVDKCCAIGQILILNHDKELVCTGTIEDVQILLDPLQTTPKGLPNCSKSDYLMERLLEDVAEQVPQNACLDIFLDPITHENFPVIVYCKSVIQVRLLKLNDNTNYNVLREIPKIMNFRKCCQGNNSFYDVDRKHCVFNEHNNSFEFLKEHLRALDFISVASSGPPTCDLQDVLVDYELLPKDIYNDATARISLTLEQPWNNRTVNFTINEYNGCLDATATRIIARVCKKVDDYCLSNSCIRKCCKENEIANEKTKRCEIAPDGLGIENFRSLLASAVLNSSAKPAFDIKRYGLLVGRSPALCYQSYTTEPWEIWEIETFGNIVQPDYTNYTNDYTNTCLEYQIQNNSSVETKLYPYFCFADDAVKFDDSPRYEIVSGFAIISCIFLLVTLLVYICLPSLQNLHGKTIMCHVISLFFAYISLALVGIMTHSVLDEIHDALIEESICRYLGYSLLFSFHSSFFWLNVMCFDIWRTFGGMHGTPSCTTGAGRNSRQQRNRFLMYCAYAWGLAFVLTGLSIITENLQLFNAFERIGRQRCWYDVHSNAEVIFFIVPVTITLIINVVLFAITSYRCSKVKAEIKRVMANVRDPKTRKFHSDRTRLIMNLKLFIVMGIPWVAEIFTTYLKKFNKYPLVVEEIFSITDIINALQGLWIFILFVLKRKVYRALRKRLKSKSKKSSSNCNTLNVQGIQGGVRKSSSNTTLTSNFLVSLSTA